MTNPGKEHWTSVKRIFRYLSGSAEKGLVFDCSGLDADTLECFSDSDWAADQDGRRSTTGYIVYLYGCAVSWKSKLQKTVAHSSTEAEYMAMSDTAREVMWLRGLLEELGLVTELQATPVSNTTPQERDAKKIVTDSKYKPYKAGKEVSGCAPTMMLADNQGAIQLAKNPISHERSKHIDIKHHYIREITEDGKIIPSYVNTKLNDADMFTKTTSTTEDFVQCRDRVMGYDQGARKMRHQEREKARNMTMREKQNQAKVKKATLNLKKKAAKLKKLN
jgi:hypothetical protein